MVAEEAGDIVSVEFELTPEDWVEVALEHSARSPLTKEAMRNVTVLFGALIVVAALLSLVSGFASGAVLWLLIGGFVLTLLRPLLRSARKKQFGQFAEGGIANGMFGPHRVELRPEGMKDSTEGYEWLTRWSAIEGVREGEGAFHIYTGRDSFLPIPYTAFPDSESLRRFSDAFYRLQKTDRTLHDEGKPEALESPEVDDA